MDQKEKAADEVFVLPLENFRLCHVALQQDLAHTSVQQLHDAFITQHPDATVDPSPKYVYAPGFSTKSIPLEPKSKTLKDFGIPSSGIVQLKKPSVKKRSLYSKLYSLELVFLFLLMPAWYLFYSFSHPVHFVQRFTFWLFVLDLYPRQIFRLILAPKKDIKFTISRYVWIVATILIAQTVFGAGYVIPTKANLLFGSFSVWVVVSVLSLMSRLNFIYNTGILINIYDIIAWVAFSVFVQYYTALPFAIVGILLVQEQIVDKSNTVATSTTAANSVVPFPAPGAPLTPMNVDISKLPIETTAAETSPKKQPIRIEGFAGPSVTAVAESNTSGEPVPQPTEKVLQLTKEALAQHEAQFAVDAGDTTPVATTKGTSVNTNVNQSNINFDDENHSGNVISIAKSKTDSSTNVLAISGTASNDDSKEGISLDLQSGTPSIFEPISPPINVGTPNIFGTTPNVFGTTPSSILSTSPFSGSPNIGRRGSLITTRTGPSGSFYSDTSNTSRNASHTFDPEFADSDDLLNSDYIAIPSPDYSKEPLRRGSFVEVIDLLKNPDKIPENDDDDIILNEDSRVFD